MPQARQNQISLDATSIYHCISRCVRRQYLCGVDTNTGKDFSHRRDWIRARIFELQAIFAIDVYAYAVMSNHAHLVLCLQQDETLVWDDKGKDRHFRFINRSQKSQFMASSEPSSRCGVWLKTSADPS